MATVSFRIDDDLKAEIDHLSETRDLNVSGLFRSALEKAVEEARYGSDHGHGLKLSLLERLMLCNQYRILELLECNQSDTAASQELLREGYESQYHELIRGFDPRGVSVATSREVLDILEMHRMMHFAVGDLGKDSGVSGAEIKFRGFDGNNEFDQIGFVRYFLSTLGRYRELHHEDHDYNSHCPMLPTYRSMLKAWNASGDRNKLNKADLQRIINAPKR